MDFGKLNSKTLWIVSIGIILLCCGVIIYYNLNNFDNTSCLLSKDCSSLSVKPEAYQQCKPPCTSEDCIDIANTISSYMDSSGDACQDFYTFACGNFHKMYHGKYSTFNVPNERFFLNLKGIIETSNETHYPESAAQKLKIVYDSCMDTKSSELTTLRYMLTFINEIGIINWPNLDPNIGYFKTQLPDVLGKLITFSEYVFLNFTEEAEDTVSLATPSELFDHHKEEDAKSLLVFILRMVGMNSEDAKNIIASFLELKHTLHGIIENSTHSANTTSLIRMDCRRENTKNTGILCEVIRSAYENGGKNFQFLIIKDEYAYFHKEISHLLENYDQRMLAHYIALSIFYRNLNYMNFKSIKILTKNYILIDGFNELNLEFERWKFCVNYLKSNMILPLGLIYVSEIWKQEAIDLIEEMGDMLQKATSLFIRAQDWLADSTKLKIISKISKVKRRMTDIIKSYRNRINMTEIMPKNKTESQFISSEFSVSAFIRGLAAGKIERDENYFLNAIKMFRNKKKINEEYQKFQPLKDNFLYNVMQNKRRHFISKYDEDSLESQISELTELMFITNAFYYEDSYYLTFGILTPSFFKSTYTRLLNIARIGFVISHEIGHSVYSDKDKNDPINFLVLIPHRDRLLSALSHIPDCIQSGVLNLFPRWKHHNAKALQNITQKHMDESIACRANQYSNFVMERIGQKLITDISENDDFSDTVAIQVTEKVVKSLLQSSMETITGLPGLNYSPEEIFYLFLAQTWCDVRPEYLDWNVLYDAHSPPEFRVRGMLQNSKRFSEVFNCPTGSYMNPAVKCPVFTDT